MRVVPVPTDAVPEPVSQIPLSVPVMPELPGTSQDVVPEILEPTATHTPQDVEMDLVSTLEIAFTANQAANNSLHSPLHNNRLDDDDVENMEWTLPGSDRLTQRAYDFANQFIDQTKFADGVSPITKIFRPQAPERIDGPLTELEVERIHSLSSLNINRVHSPPPIAYQALPDEHVFSRNATSPRSLPRR